MLGPNVATTSWRSHNYDAVAFNFASLTQNTYSIGGIACSSSRLGRSYWKASPSPQEFENLLQAATSSANGVAMGGDFAGLAATFDPGTGDLIPIPEHLVPNALLEWGQEPKCLEILVSEENQEDSMLRSTITILPDTGCSIDNLETIKVEDEVDLSTKFGKGGNLVGLQYPINGNRDASTLRLETVFGMDDGYRIRVLLDLNPSASVFAVQCPMVIAMERRTNTVSSSGTIADGGGLDGRTVSLLLGEKLRGSKTFADEEPLEDNQEKNGIKYVGFPGKIGIAYGWFNDKDWVVQIGHVHKGRRRVISRTFFATEGEEFGFDVESWTEDFEMSEA